MKANKLMIGDWVQNPLGWKAQVQSIRYVNTIKDEWEWLVKIGINNETFQGNLSLNEIGAIPLTAEILEKNGFRKDTGGEECWANSKGWFTPHEYGKRDTIKSWEVEICGKICSFDGVIKYIHELQHALRLCGIEKEIEL